MEDNMKLITYISNVIQILVSILAIYSILILIVELKHAYSEKNYKISFSKFWVVLSIIILVIFSSYFIGNNVTPEASKISKIVINSKELGNMELTQKKDILKIVNVLSKYKYVKDPMTTLSTNTGGVAENVFILIEYSENHKDRLIWFEIYKTGINYAKKDEQVYKIRKSKELYQQILESIQ